MSCIALHYLLRVSINSGRGRMIVLVCPPCGSKPTKLALFCKRTKTMTKPKAPRGDLPRKANKKAAQAAKKWGLASSTRPPSVAQARAPSVWKRAQQLAPLLAAKSAEQLEFEQAQASLQERYAPNLHRHRNQSRLRRRKRPGAREAVKDVTIQLKEPRETKPTAPQQRHILQFQAATFSLTPPRQSLEATMQQVQQQLTLDADQARRTTITTTLSTNSYHQAPPPVVPHHQGNRWVALDDEENETTPAASTFNFAPPSFVLSPPVVDSSAPCLPPTTTLRRDDDALWDDPDL
jgi:hypothetical protein